MHYQRYIIICIIAIFVLSGTKLKAQPQGSTTGFEQQKQAAVNELKKYPDRDTSRVKALIAIFSLATFLKEREQVAAYQEEAMEISRQLNYTYGMVMCLASRASHYKSASDYSNAQKYYDSALYISVGAGDPAIQTARANIFFRKGMIYHVQENYYPALNNFFAALKNTSDPSRALAIRVFIADSYILLNNPDKGLEYIRPGIAYLEKHPELQSLGVSVYNAAVGIFLNKGQLDSADYYVEKIYPFANDPRQVQIRFGYYLKKGHIAFKRGRYAESMDHYRLAQQAAKEGGHPNSISTALYCLSATSLKLGNNELAKNYSLQNLSLLDSSHSTVGRIDALINLAAYYHAVGNDKKAYTALEESMEMKDSLLSETNIRQVNLLGAIYERELQQKEIARLQAEKELQAADVKQKSTLNKLFLLSIVALLVLGYLGYANFRKSQQLARNKEALQKQKIIDLEKDRHLSSVNAMLKGQEEERNRIAKDLHDGLGGLLSGTKLSFLNIKEKLSLSQDEKFHFEKSLSMLDNTIIDLRKIAQNLLPEALVKYGLHDALSDYCDSIHSSTGIRIYYQQYGERRTLDNTAAVFIFRIIQELVTNVVKHAQATELIVQVIFSEKEVTITVEDNGKGFDKTYMESRSGAGINNVSYRVQYFNGTMEVESSPGKGTTVNIQLNV